MNLIDKPLESDEKIELCFIDMIAITEQFFPNADVSKINVLPNLIPDEYHLKRCFAESEIEKILSFKTLKKQVEKMSGILALKVLTNGFLDPGKSHKTKKPFASIVISNYASGCPFIVDYEKFSVSVSHSQNKAVAALALNPKIGVGIDIESLRNFEIDYILKVVFSNRERDFYKDKTSEEIIEAFCFKEAYLKYIRKGFSINPTNIELIGGDVFFEKKPVLDIHKALRRWESHYIFAVVYGHKASNVMYI